jgi:hypothetical protein
MVGALIRAGGLLLLGAACTAQAQGLPDPTRPPSALMSPALAGETVSDGKSGSGDTRLQSIILRQGAKPRALINGEWLELGQSSGDSKVVKISADRVEMKGPQGRQTIRLMPDVDKRAVVAERSGNPTQGKQK